MLQRLGDHNPRKFAKFFFIDFLAPGLFQKALTWSYNDFMASNRETVKNFSYIDFKSACCLKLTEHDVATITWPQSAKIREIFIYRIFYYFFEIQKISLKFKKNPHAKNEIRGCAQITSDFFVVVASENYRIYRKLMLLRH